MPDSNARPLLQQAEAVARQFALSAGDVARTARSFVDQMRNGLAAPGTTQIPSFVTRVPNGAETGLFLAVDLGGTNCRVCSVDLRGDGTYALVQAKHAVPRPLMVQTSHEPLFAFVAACIGDFLHAHAPARPPAVYRLGFTFSFTYRNTSLAHGVMLQWDKGWAIPDALGRDPQAMLQAAIDAAHLPVRVTALVNDSVGTLLARAYAARGAPTLIGAIFGTGTNAAYIERRANVQLANDQGADSDIMLINTEWGGWADAAPQALPTTAYDVRLDREATNPGAQLVEKRISGLYLGELARLALLDLAQARLLSLTVDAAASPLHCAYAIDGAFLTKVAEAHGRSLADLQDAIADTLQAQHVSADDARAIHCITTAIVRRAARLAGAAMAAIILQSGRLDIDLDPESGSDKERPPPRGPWTRAPVWLRSVAGYLFCCTAEPPDAAASTNPTAASTTSTAIDIGIDGQLFEAYPTFAADVRSALRDIPQIGPVGERRIRIGLTKDGSGVGAALAAQSLECA